MYSTSDLVWPPIKEPKQPQTDCSRRLESPHLWEKFAGQKVIIASIICHWAHWYGAQLEARLNQGLYAWRPPTLSRKEQFSNGEGLNLSWIQKGFVPVRAPPPSSNFGCTPQKRPDLINLEPEAACETELNWAERGLVILSQKRLMIII